MIKLLNTIVVPVGFEAILSEILNTKQQYCSQIISDISHNNNKVNIYNTSHADDI